MGLACVVFVLWIILEIAYLFKEAEGVKRYCPFLILLMLALPADYSLLEVLYLFAGIMRFTQLHCFYLGCIWRKSAEEKI